MPIRVRYPQKSLALFARKEYGKGSFDYKVFKDKPIEKFESLVLRNAGNDWDQAMTEGWTYINPHQRYGC